MELFIIESSTSKNLGFFTLSRRNKNTARPDISAPIQSTYVEEIYLCLKMISKFFSLDWFMLAILELKMYVVIFHSILYIFN